MLVVGTVLGVYCPPAWGVRSCHVLSLTARVVQRPFPENVHCTTRGERLVNTLSQPTVFCTPWTHCRGDEEVISMHTGKLVTGNRSGRMGQAQFSMLAVLVNLLI